jgi:surface antigen
LRIKRTQSRSIRLVSKPTAHIKRIANSTVKSARYSVKEAGNSVRRGTKRYFHILVPISVAVVLLGVVFVGSSGRYASENPVTRVGGFGGVSVVDELSAADIAARIAVGTDLIVSENVKNLADSQKAQVEFASVDGSYISKPQIVTTDAKTNKDIVTYVVQKGDTVSSIARRFNITSDTIRWENEISGDSVTPGKKLKILPVSGVLYTVQDGDTPKSIADWFDANSAQLIAFNDAEITGLKKDMVIVVPNGEKPVERPTYFSSNYGFAFGAQPLYGGNGYSYGYCTWHVANRRIAIGKPLPKNLGNAVTWPTLAASAGLGVGDMPRAGAVLWHKSSFSIAGGLGHVGFVEKINDDGSILVSDMNYPIWNGVTNRTISQSEFNQYLFIY